MEASPACSRVRGRGCSGSEVSVSVEEKRSSMGDLMKGADTALTFLASVSDSVVRATNATPPSSHAPPAAAPAPDRTPPPASPSSSREQTPEVARDEEAAADAPQTPGR